MNSSSATYSKFESASTVLAVCKISTDRECHCGCRYISGNSRGSQLISRLARRYSDLCDRRSMCSCYRDTQYWQCFGNGSKSCHHATMFATSGGAGPAPNWVCWRYLTLAPAQWQFGVYRARGWRPWPLHLRPHKQRVKKKRMRGEWRVVAK